MTKNLSLCLHGHFYQPPRENPWIEKIELQETAAPFHDWNERIYYECYLPNAKARVLDEKGRVVDIANNYESLSFNFGPTLLSWLEERHPETYRHILAADRLSLERRGGHGNAMAQVYNHMILPLAHRRDKITQIKWGLQDFRFRFGREAESIWLPETACNAETLEVLAEQGIKFLILEPHQAQSIRPLNGGQWQDVSSGQIDPKRAYRCFASEDRKRYVDIFFFDGPISKAVGFGDLLFDAKRFMDRLEGARIEKGDKTQLVHVATDGETYGHHKPFADRVLAYLAQVEAPKKNISLVNYGQFLEAHPPEWEVRLKEGEEGEGTSWSCAHGVKRWKEHCGCRTGGEPHWTQHWRKPLREALDWLRDELLKVYENFAGSYLKNIWEAREDYIQVILDRSKNSVTDFFSRHGLRELSRDEITSCLKLLESQRHAMLMVTSCGWFFVDISGVETVQILQYAARAIQLASEISGHSLEGEFVERLSQAKSNLPEVADGRGVYEQRVKPAFKSFHHIASYYAIGSLFEDYFSEKENLSIYCFKLRVLHQRKESFGTLTLNFGRVKIFSKITWEEQDLVFGAIQIGTYDFRCSMRPFENPLEFEKIEKELFENLRQLHIVELLRKIDEAFGETYYALKDLLREDRMAILSLLTRESVEKISEVYGQIYDDHRRINEIYRSTDLPIPEELRYAVSHTLAKRLKAAAVEFASEGCALKKATKIYQIIDEAKSFHVDIRKEEAGVYLSKELSRRSRSLLNALKPEIILECLRIEKLAKKIGLELDPKAAQDYLFQILKKWKETPEAFAHLEEETLGRFLQLVASSHINPQEFKEVTQSRLKEI